MNTQPSVRAWHAMTADAVAEAWETDPERGLTPEAVIRRRERIGLNELPHPPAPSPLKQLAAQFINPLVLTLLAAAAVSVFVALHNGEGRGVARFSDALAILLIVVVNAVIGFYQERRAERALDALQQMSAPRCRIKRNGLSMTVDTVQLVPGDLVELAEGDSVPADLRVIESASLETLEGAITGESESVAKDARKVLAPDVIESDQINMAFMGTTVVRGTARGIVVATGRQTRLGHIGDMLANSEKPKSPLEQRLATFGKQILIACMGISMLLFIIGIVQGGRWHVLLLVAVSVAVAVIPEGLPAITTITLALGMQRMARRHAIVRNLSAVETLGSVRIICSDKTGTLTCNEMTVQSLWAAGVDYDVTGEGYTRRGELRESISGETLDEVPDTVRRVIEIGAVANKAHLDTTQGKVNAAGDPTEIALLALGTKLGAPRNSIVEASKTALELAFDSDRKRMTLVIKRGDRFTAYTKGAVEKVLPLCSHWRTHEGIVALDAATRAEILAKVDALSMRALRVLAFADREGGREVQGDDTLSDEARAESVERDLVFAGLVGMKDPARPEVKTAIDQCRRAGIRAVMITGDHPLTAEAIARELGLWEEGDQMLTGGELARMPDQRLQDVIHRVRVFARVSPEHKLRIVRAFQGPPNFDVVAMTGDGVNDAPALRDSSIGIAMGKNGTDVARQAADMVLADDNFATIVEAVREGRAIFSNIKKSIFFLLSSNAGLCFTVFATVFFKDMPPLSPLQILWINLVTNGLPALALGVDPPEADQMSQPPRAPGESFLTRRDWWGILAVGVLMAGSAVLIYRLPLWSDPTSAETIHSKVTMVFTVLAISPLFHAFNCRSEHQSIFRVGIFSNRFLVVAVVLSGAVHVLALVVPPLRPVFRSNHVWSLSELLIVVGLSVLPIPVIELVKVFMRPARKAAEKAAAAASSVAAAKP